MSVGAQPAGYFDDGEYPADPYPGARPPDSFVHIERTGWVLREDAGTCSGWRLAATGTDLDDWLAAAGAAPLADRLPVLAYGSNACPAKITWLRESLGLRGPVVVLTADCADLAAVWTTGTRARDDQRPATLMAAPGVAERHAVWFADAAQLDVLDDCEVRDTRYRLVRLHSGRVRLSGGAVLDGPLAYLGLPPTRLPLLVHGNPVRCAELGQSSAIHLAGTPGADGLRGVDVVGRPAPTDWPDRLFVYGTLGPDGPAWPLARPLVHDTPERAHARGLLYDSGRGYPALVPAAGAFRVPGHLLRLRDPRTALATLDGFEGPGFSRARTVLADGSVCWVYYWNSTVAGLAELASWP